MSSSPHRVDKPLADQLGDLARRIEEGPSPVLLVADDLQVHPEALADLTTTAALVSRASTDSGGRATGPAYVRLRAGVIAAATSSVHRTTARDAVFTGALRISDADRAGAAAAARDAASVAGELGWVADPVDVLLVALTRSGVAVAAVPTDPWPWRRGASGADRDALQTRLDRLGPEQVHRLRLARARKSDDGAWATLVSRPLSRLVMPVATRLGVTPNQVTLASFLVGLAAAAGFATGEHALLLTGAVLLQLSLVLDCVDGDVARYQRSGSATGAWLDATTDRLKEFACYGGLAWGSGVGGEAWLLAGAMLTLQTVRHTVDYTFTAVKELREDAAAVRLGLAEPDDRIAGPATASARAVAASERSNQRPVVRWGKRALHLSIGERWAVLSVFAALGRPVLALAVLLGLGLVSFAYTTAGRSLRTRAWTAADPSQREREIVGAQLDVPGLTRRFAGSSSRWLWAWPSALRLVEYAAVLALTLAVDLGAAAAAFALLLVVASHHYDALYRVLHRLRPSPRVLRVIGLGLVGRLVVVVVVVLALAVAGRDTLEAGLWALAVLLGMLFLVVEPVRVLREVRRG